MLRVLVISVRLHDGRFHGHPVSEWPPSPARLFQALTAASATGKSVADEDRLALKWLESLPPPLISAPNARPGQRLKNYVPNNDLDAVGGDPGRVSEIRTPKQATPRIFNANAPLRYGWRFADGESYARRICDIANRLYQLGRGVDMAWAHGDIVDQSELDERLGGCGVRYIPGGNAQFSLPCPQPGSLASLEERFERTRHRFHAVKVGKTLEHVFSQAPKPRFAMVSYKSLVWRFLFDLRDGESATDFVPWPLTDSAALVEAVRRSASQHLATALPDRESLIDRIFIGKHSTESDKSERIRVIPLPSIGHSQADHAIRRVLVEIPANCPLPADDIEWSFSGLEPCDPETGECLGRMLVPAVDSAMLTHFGVGTGSRFWRTITPSVFPQGAARRRIDPRRMHDRTEQKQASERAQEERKAAIAVRNALRHAGIAARAQTIRVQREPWTAKGARAENFAAETRFPKERLWHVQIEFAEPIEGAIVIGDGRYVGLGVMAPIPDLARDVFAFSLNSGAGIPSTDASALARAARRALMSLARGENGRVPLLFSGHEEDGGPARSGAHRHVFIAPVIAADGKWIDRLIIAAPWVCDRSYAANRPDQFLFDDVVSSLAELRAGRLGVIRLDQAQTGKSDDVLLGPSLHWETRTAYRPVRHPQRRKDAAEAVKSDLLNECLRRGLPKPEIQIEEISSGPNGGNVSAKARLSFAVAVSGPVLLGSGSHAGDGLFTTVAD